MADPEGGDGDEPPPAGAGFSETSSFVILSINRLIIFL